MTKVLLLASVADAFVKADGDCLTTLFERIEQGEQELVRVRPGIYSIVDCDRIIVFYKDYRGGSISVTEIRELSV